MMLTLITGWSLCLSGWLTHYKIPFFPFLYCTICRKRPFSAYTSEVGSYASLPWDQSISINYLEFCMEDLSLLHSQCIWSFIYISIISWMFILYFGLYFVQLNFFAQILPTLATGSSLNWLLYLSDISHHCVYAVVVVVVAAAVCVCVCMCMLSTSLIFWHYKMVQVHGIYFLSQSSNQPCL